MTEAVEKRAVLAAFDDEEFLVDGVAGVDIVEHPFQGYFNLRCDLADERVAAAVSGVARLALPVEPNTTAETEGVTIYWLGPDEWLLRTPTETTAGPVARLREALADEWHALTDNSGGMTHLCLRGESCLAVLAQGVTVDLHPREFTPGQCAQTVMARSNVLIAPAGPGARAFDLLVRRSFADHLLMFLRDAAHDVGYRFSRAPA